MKPSVLVIDDDVDATFLLGSYFNRAGFETHLAHSMSEAKTALTDERIAAVFCDRQLGDGDGLMLFAQGRPPWVKWAVILSGEPTMRTELEDARFDSSMEKPFDVAKLVAEARSKLS